MPNGGLKDWSGRSVSESDPQIVGSPGTGRGNPRIGNGSMQRDGSEKRQMLEVRDLERPLGGGLTPIKAVIEVAKSDCPDEWARYCELAHRLQQPRPPTAISREEAGRQLLDAHSKFFHQKRAVGRLSMPLIELEKMTAETLELQRLFRNRLVFQSGRYRIEAFRGHEPCTVNTALIKPEHFRFDSDEMEVNEIKLVGVRFVRAEAVPASQNDPPRPKPGQQSAKDRLCQAALSILNDPAKRPPRGHGRKAKIARLLYKLQPDDGRRYEEDSIVRMIRDTITEWETNNPDE
jgi:hypothetical protein